MSWREGDGPELVGSGWCCCRRDVPSREDEGVGLEGVFRDAEEVAYGGEGGERDYGGGGGGRGGDGVQRYVGGGEGEGREEEVSVGAHGDVLDPGGLWELGDHMVREW